MNLQRIATGIVHNTLQKSRRLVSSVLFASLLSACSGGNSTPDTTNSMSSDGTDPIAVLVQRAQENETGTVSVLIDLDTSNNLTVASTPETQAQFLNRLETAVMAAGCPQVNARAHSVRVPTSAAVVGIVLNACELEALRTLPEIQSIVEEITLSHQLSAIDQAVIDSYNGIDNAIHKASQMIECTHDHKTRLWHELRGLLVLRYKMEKTNTEELGITVIQTVIAEVEQHLAASGYAEKIDGLNLSEVLWQTAAGDR